MLFTVDGWTGYPALFVYAICDQILKYDNPELYPPWFHNTFLMLHCQITKCTDALYCGWMDRISGLARYLAFFFVSALYGRIVKYDNPKLYLPWFHNEFPMLPFQITKCTDALYCGWMDRISGKICNSL